jgi:RNA polymerase sigma-70 factor (ECF subfamily)
MNGQEWQAEHFEQSRTHLHAVAYRMLGSSTDADDAVQEAWLRLNRSDVAAVENLTGWLTTVVSRICLDMLRSRRARREEPGEGWEQEPIVPPERPADPEAELLLADSVGLALLVVLETLTPAERLAFVLHDMFGIPFGEIAPIVDRDVPATRQLASRARRRVRGAGTEARAEQIATQRKVVDAFLAASRSGDFEALVAVLHPDVVFRADRFGVGAAAGPVELRGPREVAAGVLERGSRFAQFARPALVDGRAGLVVVLGERVFSVLGLKLRDGRVSELDLTRDPEKLRAVRI